VLFVTLDTTRADYLGCYGRAEARTPNIDRLAKEGTLFRQCRTCSPFTFPSHASIMTGLYPYDHGARRNGTGRLSEANVTLAEVLKGAGYATRAAVASFVLDQKFGLSQGFDEYRDVIVRDFVDELHAERRGDDVCDDAVAMLESLTGQPFFLWVHFYDPHYPYLSDRGLDPASPAAYEEEIAFMDGQIGRLVDALARLGRDRDTLVVLVGDHGEGLGQHQELLHGTFLYESTLHVPLILWCPERVPAGRVVESQVRSVDIAPTVMEILACPPLDAIHGASLASLLVGDGVGPTRLAYAESFEARDVFGLSGLRSMADGGWKYVLAPKAELYDLNADPDENRNLIEDQPQRGEEMREQLRSLLTEASPVLGSSARETLSASEVARLESLGYVYAAPPGGAPAATELENFEPRGGDPKDHAAYFELKAKAGGALRSRDFLRAESLFRPLVQAFPQVATFRVDLARALFGQGRNAEAKAAYEETVAAAPTDPHALWALGHFLLFDLQQYAEAAQQLHAALELKKNDVSILHDLGVALTALRRFDQAEICLQRAAELEPRSPQVVQATGVLYLQQGRRAEAAEYFRKTLDLAPDSQEARQALEYVKRLPSG